MKKNIELESLKICLLAIIEKLSDYGEEQTIKTDEMRFAIKWLFERKENFVEDLEKYRKLKKQFNQLKGLK